MKRLGLPSLALGWLGLAAAAALAQDPAQPEPASEPVAADQPRQATAGEETPGSVPPVPAAAAGPQLLMEELRPGVGVEARPGMVLAVHYTGWLHEPGALGQRGRQFDSSRERGQPFVFQLGAGRVIRGWELGVVGMRVGSLRRLVIPPELAYGSRNVGNGLIPPDSTLVFEIDLLGVESVTFVEDAK